MPKASSITIGRLKLKAVEDLDKALKAKYDAEREIDRCKSFLTSLEDDPDRFAYFNEWFNSTINIKHEKLSL